MPFWLVKQQLQGRGYWNQADEDGGQGGGGGSDAGADDAGDQNDGGDDSGDNGSDEGADKAEKKAEKKPSDAEAKLLKDMMKWKNQARELQNQLSEVNRRFDGIDPDAVKSLLQEREEAENKKLEAKGDFERLKQKMADAQKAELQKKQEEIDALKSQLGGLSGTINELTVGQSFSQSKFIAEELTLTPAKARIVYGDHFDVVDGKVVAYDKPRSASERTPIVDANGEPVSFEAAIQKLVDADPDRDHLKKAKGKPGAGSNTQKGKAAEQKPQLHGRDRIGAALAAGKGISS